MAGGSWQGGGGHWLVGGGAWSQEAGLRLAGAAGLGGAPRPLAGVAGR